MNWGSVLFGSIFITAIIATVFVTIYVAVRVSFGRRFGLQLDAIAKKVDGIVESQRLSTILKIESASLKVDPAKFEPNKERLTKRVLDAIDLERRRDQPRTWAFCILNAGGLSEFVDKETSLQIQGALARLLVNGEMEEARRFLREIVEKL